MFLSWDCNNTPLDMPRKWDFSPTATRAGDPWCHRRSPRAAWLDLASRFNETYLCGAPISTTAVATIDS